MTMMVGSMATGMHIDVAIAKSLYNDLRYHVVVLWDREREGERSGLV